MNRSFGGFILYIATALYLLAAGILGIFFRGKGGEFTDMAGVIFRGGLASTVGIIFAIVAIVAGILLILQLFGMEFGIIEIILIAFAILWIVFILVRDIIGFGGHGSFWLWLRNLGSHLIVLGAIATGTRLFGGGN